MANDIPVLNERAQMLLKALVERYITDGQPVGSRALSRVSGLDLSPASIRNVMADLEELGFIASPHTSAGRFPRRAVTAFSSIRCSRSSRSTASKSISSKASCTPKTANAWCPRRPICCRTSRASPAS